MTASAVLGFLDTDGPAAGTQPLILCIDGRAGSGKTTLATEVAANFDGTSAVVHTDDLCPGWDGLPLVPALLAALVAPLASGRRGTYPRYDWLAGRVAEDVVVDPSDLLVVEGVGAGSRALRPWRTALVWLEVPVTTRKGRALARDGDSFAPFWDQWAAAERHYLRTEADRDRADLVLRPGTE